MLGVDNRTVPETAAAAIFVRGAVVLVSYVLRLPDESLQLDRAWIVCPIVDRDARTLRAFRALGQEVFHVRPATAPTLEVGVAR